MALERVPSDIRRDGGVARMSDPEMIEGIKAAVTIPVMAKARIGHFVEAQILEALGVDYVDESEVLTPADEAHHIDKWAFTVPFVCGATNLGEALRRISEGACMIRSKGEAGTGNIVEAVRHLRSILGDIRKITQADSAELFDWAKQLQAPLPLVQEIARHRRAARADVLRRGHRHPGRRRARDAARRRGRVRRLGHLQERGPRHDGQGHRRGHHPLPGPRDPGQGQPRPRPVDARPRDRRARDQARRSGLVASSRPSCRAGPVPVGVLALQGAFALHAAHARSPRRRAVAGPHARRARPGRRARHARRRVDDDVDAARLAPGCSTRWPSALADGMADVRHVRRRRSCSAARSSTAGPTSVRFGAIDVAVRRNGYGRQVDSFEADLDVAGARRRSRSHAVFIRAPVVERVGADVEVLAAVEGSTARIGRCSCRRAYDHWSPSVPSGAERRPLGSTRTFLESI